MHTLLEIIWGSGTLVGRSSGSTSTPTTHDVQVDVLGGQEMSFGHHRHRVDTVVFSLSPLVVAMDVIVAFIGYVFKKI